MGDLDDAAARVTAVASYLEPSQLAQQAAAIEMVVATLLGVSETSPMITKEVEALHAVQRRIQDVTTMLRLRQIRLDVLAKALKGGFS